jgi:ribosomal protein S6--L-glutamate ligase
MRRLRIGFLLPRYSRHSASQMPLVMRALTEAGVVVEVVRPTNRIVELSRLVVEHDLYVLKKISGLALSLAGALHSRGAAIVNPYPVTVALYDKIIMCRILQAAGVPTPATFVVAHPEELTPLLDAGPLVVKPYQGTGGEGVRVVRSAAALADVPHDKKDPVFAQRYHEPEGRDRKIYRIGDRFFGVKKVFPARTEAEKYGEPFTPTPELCDIVQRCGQAFGIDLYGVDIVESEGQPYVVDMSSIPGFKGVPDAPSHLAKYYYAVAERAAQGRPLREPAAAIEAVRAAGAS